MVGIVSFASMNPHKYDIFLFIIFNNLFPHITKCLGNKFLHMRLELQVVPEGVQDVLVEEQVVRVEPFRRNMGLCD